MESLQVTQVKSNFFEDNNIYEEIDPENFSAVKGFQSIDENEDEVWLLQCPKGLDVKKLEGHKLKFPGRIKIKEFEATALEAATPKTMAFGYTRRHKYNIRLLNIAGTIVLRDQMTAPSNVTEENIFESCPATTVPMPEYIKLRHPLLGAKFDEYFKSTNHYGKSEAPNKNFKTPIKLEKSSNKRSYSTPAIEDSPKKSKTKINENRKKSLPNSLDISEELKWIKDL